MKTYLLIALSLFLISISFAQTEIKVPELHGSVIIMRVENNGKSQFLIEDGSLTSFKTELNIKKDELYSDHLHAVANAIQQIIDQKYKLFSVFHLSSTTSAVYYFIKE